MVFIINQPLDSSLNVPPDMSTSWFKGSDAIISEWCNKQLLEMFCSSPSGIKTTVGFTFCSV